MLNLQLINQRIANGDRLASEIYQRKKVGCATPQDEVSLQNLLADRKEWVEILLVCSLHNAQEKDDDNPRTQPRL